MRTSLALLLAGVAWGGLGCAAKHRVALDCVPHDVTVYVDGRELRERPEAVELSRDEPHTVYFKGGGYRPQMIVFESTEVEGEHRLTPTDICSETIFAEMEPDVQMVIDPDVAEGPP